MQSSDGSGLLGAGIAIGVAVGVAIDNVGAGIAVGVAIGAALAKRHRDSNPSAEQPGPDQTEEPPS